MKTAYDEAQSLARDMELHKEFILYALNGLVAFPGNIDGKNNRNADVIVSLSMQLADRALIAYKKRWNLE